MPALPPVSAEPVSPFSIEEDDIDALLSEFNNDPRAAIRALLHDLTMLAEDRASHVSYGYVRGRLYPNENALNKSA